MPGSQLSAYSNRPGSRFKAKQPSYMDDIGEIGEEEEVIIKLVMKKKEKVEALKAQMREAFMRKIGMNAGGSSRSLDKKPS